MKRIVILILGTFVFAYSNAQQLETLIEEAIANSPEIQKFELRYQMTTERINEVNSLPDTQFGVGYFVSEPETRTGAQRAKISVKQSIPWFGSITARENYANSISDVKFEDIVIAKRKLVAAVSQSYYNVYAITAKQHVLEHNIALLKTYETLALNAVETGNASAVDVLRLQMRQNEMEELKRVLEQDLLSEQSHLNNLLNRESVEQIQVVNELTMPIENSLVTSDNLQLHPELTKYDKLYESVTRSELLNQKESRPMVGIGLDYIAVSERPDMSFADNGKDIIMPMVSLSIPVFTKKYKSTSRQNELKQQEITAEKLERYNTLKAILDKAINDRVSARIRYETISKNLQQAKDAEEILLKNYETGTIDFNDVLDIQELQLKFQLNEVDAIKKYYVQSTIINYLSS
jgi:outer membrane protein TolC